MNPRRIRLMEDSWQILSSAFSAALMRAAEGKGQDVHDGTRPGRLVATVGTTKGGSATPGPRDADLGGRIEPLELDIDYLVRLCRDQNNPSPVVADLLRPLIVAENSAFLATVCADAERMPDLSVVDDFLKDAARSLPARPLILLLRTAEEPPSDKLTNGVQIRTEVPLPPGCRGLVYSGAQHLVIHQVIEPVTLDWDIADKGKVALFVFTRAILRRQGAHKALLWAEPSP
jgi:hypothetical protein